jgi:hypothetical protein
MRKFLIAFCALLVSSTMAWADNTTFATAQNLMPGQPPVSFTLNASTPVRYYVFTGVAGRSYCAEMVTTSETSIIADSTIAIYRQTQIVAVANDNTAEEPLSGTNAPAGGGLSRACYIAQGSESLYVVVSQPSPSITFQWQARLVETTLFSNWFFVTSDYTAFTMLRNTTSSPLNYTINWRNGAGVVVASLNGVLGPNGGAFVDARSRPATLGSTVGTVEIVHNSSPDAIVASTTVLSPATGLSFDAPFVKRQPW